MSAAPESLKALADRVEAGKTGGSLVASVRAALRQHGAPVDVPAAAALRGSLDACLALHKAVLGERWGWDLDACKEGVSALVYPDGLQFDPDAQDGNAPSPARAWLAAILRAVAAEREAEG